VNKKNLKPKAKMVYTPEPAPGSRMSSGQGRPKKPGWNRKGNYGTKYQVAVMLQAIEAVKKKEMSSSAVKHFKVPFCQSKGQGGRYHR
jgi:hypothetical protein